MVFLFLPAICFCCRICWCFYLLPVGVVLVSSIVHGDRVHRACSGRVCSFAVLLLRRVSCCSIVIVTSYIVMVMVTCSGTCPVDRDRVRYSVRYSTVNVLVVFAVLLIVFDRCCSVLFCGRLFLPAGITSWYMLVGILGCTWYCCPAAGRGRCWWCFCTSGYLLPFLAFCRYMFCQSIVFWYFLVQCFYLLLYTLVHGVHWVQIFQIQSFVHLFFLFSFCFYILAFVLVWYILLYTGTCCSGEVLVHLVHLLWWRGWVFVIWWMSSVDSST